MRIGVEGFVGAERGVMSFRESGSRKGGIVTRFGGLLSTRKDLPPAKSWVTNRVRSKITVAANAVWDELGSPGF